MDRSFRTGLRPTLCTTPLCPTGVTSEVTRSSPLCKGLLTSWDLAWLQRLSFACDPFPHGHRRSPFPSLTSTLLRHTLQAYLMSSQRTTLNLDADLVRELMRATRARTKTEAVTRAMTELIRRKKLDKLKS